jgi:hypothetical protein
VEPTLARTTGPLDPDYVAAREITRSKDAEPLPPTF